MEKDNEKKMVEVGTILRENRVTSKEVEEALAHHIEQLRKSGVTLEDSVCEVLRKVLAQTQAQEELYNITSNPKYL